MNIKPAMWACSPSEVAPEWRWFWESNPVFAAPFWEHDGKPRSYGTSERLRNASTMPSWSIGTPGYGVRSTGIGDGNFPSLTSQTLEFGEGSYSNDNNYVEGVLTTSGSVTIFVVTELPDVNTEFELYNPVGTSTVTMLQYGDSTWPSSGNRDALEMQLVSGSNQFRIRHSKQVTFQVLFSLSDPDAPQPDELFTTCIYQDKDNVGHFYINGKEVVTQTSFTWGEDRVAAVGVGARGHWNDGIWPRPIYGVYIWDDQLRSTMPTDAEIKQLSVDPFGPFRQSPRGFEWVERRPTIRVRARGRG